MAINAALQEKNKSFAVYLHQLAIAIIANHYMASRFFYIYSALLFEREGFFYSYIQNS